MTSPTDRGRWFPAMPPMLPGEDAGAYTGRLTGSDRTGREPYDHRRNRQCSIGWHGECSEVGVPADRRRCKCPCHTAVGALELEVWQLQESVVALHAIASGRLAPRPDGGAWRRRLIEGEQPAVDAIVAARPNLAEWYIAPAADRGGSLPPGFVTATNDTSEPERVHGGHGGAGMPGEPEPRDAARAAADEWQLSTAGRYWPAGSLPAAAQPPAADEPLVTAVERGQPGPARRRRLWLR